MLVEGRECSDAFCTFKRRVVGRSVYPNFIDKQRRLSYNRYLGQFNVLLGSLLSSEE
jgi:hypothetical protein